MTLSEALTLAASTVDIWRDPAIALLAGAALLGLGVWFEAWRG